MSTIHRDFECLAVDTKLADLERQLAEVRSCDIWLTDNLSLWMAFMMKAHRNADRALAEAQRKLEAVEEWSDNLKALAQEFGDLRALDRILSKEGNDG